MVNYFYVSFIYACLRYFFVNWVNLGYSVGSLPHISFFRFTIIFKAMRFHQQRISIIVVPLMLFELLSGLYLAHAQWTSLARFHSINIALIVIIWVHTFGIMVPFHNNISTQLNHSLLQKTLRYHWIRTLSWSIKSILWGAILWHLLPT